MFPTITCKLYGVITGSEVYGFMFTAYSLATILGRTLSDILLEDYGYNIIFYILCSFSVLTAVLLYFFDLDRTLEQKVDIIESQHEIELISKT
jgi:predicted MFS family arabinose efflux permease